MCGYCGITDSLDSLDLSKEVYFAKSDKYYYLHDSLKQNMILKYVSIKMKDYVDFLDSLDKLDLKEDEYIKLIEKYEFE